MIMISDPETNSLPTQLQDLVERELEPDEELIWVGQPIPIYFTASSIAAVLFAIPWTLFALFWICGTAGFKIPAFGPEMLFPLFGVPFVLVGLGMFCSPLFVRAWLKKTAYVITDQRAIIFAGAFFSTKIVSFPPEELGKLQRKEKADGIGDVLFGGTSFADAHLAGQNQQIPGLPTNGFWNITILLCTSRWVMWSAAQTS